MAATQTTTETDEFTDDQWNALDLIDQALMVAPAGLVPSTAARAAKIETAEARALLGYLVDHRWAVTSGNGTRIRFHSARHLRPATVVSIF